MTFFKSNKVFAENQINFFGVSQAVVLVDVYLLVDAWSGWKFLCSCSSSIAAVFKHLRSGRAFLCICVP